VRPVGVNATYMFVFACIGLLGLSLPTRLVLACAACFYLRFLTVSTRPVFVCAACRCKIGSSLSAWIVLSVQIDFVCANCLYLCELSLSVQIDFVCAECLCLRALSVSSHLVSVNAACRCQREISSVFAPLCLHGLSSYT
jgi:hypothetical protein